MKIPLALLNLIHNKARSAVALAGVAFAVVLIFMQVGFYGSVEATATIAYNAVDFDVMVRSKKYLHISDTRSFSLDYLLPIRSTPGVGSVSPLYVQQLVWRSPNDGTTRGILVLASDPADEVFKSQEINSKSKLLTSDQFVLIDRKSSTAFGPVAGERFGDADIGAEPEMMGKTVRIVEHFGLGGGLSNDGTLITSERGYSRIALGRSLNDVSFALIKVAPGEDPATVRDRIAARLKGEKDVDVMTRDEVIGAEIQRWVGDTSLGLIFTSGMILGMFVGTAIVYQVLSTDVANHMAEYATLKAMGYTDFYLSRVVLVQAVILAVVGFVPGLITAEVLYRFTSWLANIPLDMNLQRVASVLLLSVAMCVLSGLGALRKALLLDPAELF